MPKKYIVLIVICCVVFLALISSLFNKSVIKLSDYNPSEDKSYTITFDNEPEGEFLRINKNNSSSLVDQLQPVYPNSPVSYLLLETPNGRYIVSKVNNTDPSVKLDTVFYQRPIIHPTDDSMNTIKASYIYGGFAVTPIFPNEYDDWSTVESVGVTAKGSGGIIYDQKVYLPLYYNIYRVAN